MQDEAPDGQPQDVGEGMSASPRSAWWPWPETAGGRRPTGPRDGAPGVDETLSLPAQEPADGRACDRAGARRPDSRTGAGTRPSRTRVPENPAIAEPVAAVTSSPGRPRPSPDPVPATVVAPDGAIVAASPSGSLRGRRRPGCSRVLTRPSRLSSRPAEGRHGPVGSIPAVELRRTRGPGVSGPTGGCSWSGSSRAGLSVVVAVALVPGLSFTSWRWGEVTRIALIFAPAECLREAAAAVPGRCDSSSAPTAS